MRRGIWTVGSIADGASATLTLAVSVDLAGAITNIATITGENENDPAQANNQAGVAVNGQLADIGMLKTVDNASPNVGDTVTFTVIAHNSGPSAATGVVVTDSLPAGLALVSATPSQGTYARRHLVDRRTRSGGRGRDRDIDDRCDRAAKRRDHQHRKRDGIGSDRSEHEQRQRKCVAQRQSAGGSRDRQGRPGQRSAGRHARVHDRRDQQRSERCSQRRRRRSDAGRHHVRGQRGCVHDAVSVRAGDTGERREKDDNDEGARAGQLCRRAIDREHRNGRERYAGSRQHEQRGFGARPRSSSPARARILRS